MVLQLKGCLSLQSVLQLNVLSAPHLLLALFLFVLFTFYVSFSMFLHPVRLPLRLLFIHDPLSYIFVLTYILYMYVMPGLKTERDWKGREQERKKER